MNKTKKMDSYIITNEDGNEIGKVGYVRVSTVEQNIARQLEAFEGLGLHKIFVEKISAKDTNRPLLQQMLEFARNGDTVYVNDFSRLARNTKDLLEITDYLNNKEVKLVSLKDNIDTSTANGKLMLTMLAAINTFEREILLERQREGIAIAKQDGKYKGRKQVERPANWNEIYGLYANRRITANEAIQRTGLKRNTFYKFVEEEKTAAQ